MNRDRAEELVRETALYPVMVLRQRLETARETDMERGSRIMAWHRLLGDYRKLISAWEAAKGRSARNLSLKNATGSLRSGTPFGGSKTKTDIQIADEILKNSKL
ncbi:MAG: hypothetical protein EOP49_20625 [Sphingobacteriales bacterium]|nr:MAG: hypothetical protein EOP49_20625 [Sphingobacteriales bacterium]